MAGLRLEIRIDDKGTATVKRVEDAHNKLERKVVAGSARMSRAVDGLRRRWQSMRGAVGRITQFLKLGLAALAIATLVVGAKFEQSMANVAAVSGATTVELQKLTAAARGLGATTAFTASQAADAMLALAQAGQSVGQITQTVGSVLLFAGAASTDLGSAAETLVQTLAQFSLAADQADRVVNVFAASLSVSLLNAERLREGLSAVGSTAAAMGLQLEQTVSVLGLLNSAGMLGGVAGTRLKNTLTRLAAPNTVLAKLLGDTSLQVHGLRAAMEALKDADPGKIFQAFGRIAAPAVLVMRIAGEEMERLEKAVTNTRKAQEMFDIQMNTVASQFKIFKSQLQENMIAAFTAARDAGFDALTDITKALKDMKPHLLTIVLGTIRLTSAFKTFVTENKPAIALFAQIAAGLSVVVFRTQLWAAANALAAGTLALLTSPITLIIAGALAATIVWVKWGDQIKEVLGAAVDKFVEFVTSLGDIATRIWDAIKWPFVKLAELASKAAGIFKKVFPEAAEAVEGMLGVLKEKGGEGIDFVIEKGGAAAGAIASATSTVVKGVGDAIAETKAKVATFLTDLQRDAAAAAGAVQAPGTPGAGGDAAAEEKAANEAYQKKLQQAQADIKLAEEVEQRRRAALMDTIAFTAARTEEWLEARLELIRSNFDEEQAAAGQNAEKQKEIEIARLQAQAEANFEHQDAILAHFLENNQIQLLAIDSLGQAYDTWVNDAIAGELHLKKTREAMWNSFKVSFLKGVAEMIKTELKQRLIAMAVARSAKDTDAAKDRLQNAKAGATKAFSAFASIPIIGPVLGAAAAAAAFAFLIAFHKGGLVGAFAAGGGARGQVPAILEPEEFVVRRSAAQSVGTQNLDFINRTGQLPPTAGGGGDVSLTVNTNGGSSDELMEYLEDEVVPAIEDIQRRRGGLRDAAARRAA